MSNFSQTMDRPLDWGREGDDWPNRSCSKFVTVADLEWHVQSMGEGPKALLIHGTGAATHSWRDFMPLLAHHFHVLAPDLPSHGFTQTTSEAHMTLPGMSQALGELLNTLEFEPQLVIGHSAGAAVLMQMALENKITPRGLVGLNSALLPFQGITGHFMRPIAQFMSRNSWFIKYLRNRALDRSRVEQLIEGTGSKIDAVGIDCYSRLFANNWHLSGTLRMMANWDLTQLMGNLAQMNTPVLLIASGNDLTISPATTFEADKKLPNSRVEYIRNLGHLAHEEDPEQILTKVLEWWSSVDQEPLAG